MQAPNVHIGYHTESLTLSRVLPKFPPNARIFMKAPKARVVIGALALLACGAVLWRVASSAMVNSRWRTNVEHGQRYLEQGSYSEAVSALEEAQFAMRKIGPEHPEYDRTRNLLADAYEGIGRYHDAYALRLETLRRARDTQGPQSPEVAAALSDLGRIHEILGETDSALGFYTQALDVWQAAYGTEHPDLVPTLFGLSRVLRRTGNLTEAAQDIEWAIGLHRRAVGPESPEMAPLENEYADILEAQGNEDLAKRFREHARQIRRTANRNINPDESSTAEAP